MIQIKTVDKIDKNLRAFQENEWVPADIAHFGRKIVWEKISKILTATEDDELVGVLELDFQVGVMHIQTIIVAHYKYGKGIGKKLMEKSEKIAKENNLHKIYLETGKTWDAGKFYEALGYKITGELPDHHEHQDFVEYTKFIK